VLVDRPDGLARRGLAVGQALDPDEVRALRRALAGAGNTALVECRLPLVTVAALEEIV
jgi:hypothetical protein